MSWTYDAPWSQSDSFLLETHQTLHNRQSRSKLDVVCTDVRTFSVNRFKP